MSDLKNIQPFDEDRNNPSLNLPDEKLQAYLEGRLSDQERHEVEVWLSDEGMEGDALEGLKELDVEETKQAVGRINRHLRSQLNVRKRGRKKPISENRWAWIAILLVLLLAVVGYFVLRLAV